MIKQMKQVKNQVEFVLESFPATRDCDKLLWLGVMVKFHAMKSAFKSEQDYLKFREWFVDHDIPHFESVRRVRQRINEDGKFIGTRRQRRMEEAEEMRQLMAGG